MFFFLSHIYEVIAAAILGLAYCVLRLFNRSATSRWSYLAVFSAMSVILNPEMIRLALVRLHSPYGLDTPDMLLRSVLAALVAVIAGIIALSRVLGSRGRLRGLPFAIFGIVGGSLWVLGYAAFIGLFIWIMSQWR